MPILHYEVPARPYQQEYASNAHAEYEMPPNKAVHTWTLCGGIYISQRAFTALLFWAGEILQDFIVPKQALRTPHCLKLWGPRSKRFLICLQTFGLRLQNYYIFLICARG